MALVRDMPREMFVLVSTAVLLAPGTGSRAHANPARFRQNLWLSAAASFAGVPAAPASGM
jgi:hypothetical protein